MGRIDRCIRNSNGVRFLGSLQDLLKANATESSFDSVRLFQYLKINHSIGCREPSLIRQTLPTDPPTNLLWLLRVSKDEVIYFRLIHTGDLWTCPECKDDGPSITQRNIT